MQFSNQSSLQNKLLIKNQKQYIKNLYYDNEKIIQYKLIFIVQLSLKICFTNILLSWRFTFIIHLLYNSLLYNF